MILATLVVIAAVAMTLAPTGSDGVTSPSADQADFTAVEEGLAFVFVENNDTLDPAYDPGFDPPENDSDSNDLPPLDYDTVAALLDSQPFTDEHVAQVQSLLDSLARLSGPGTIASLEPIDEETHTGTLVRLGTDSPHALADSGVTVENATAVQDLELHLERETLPASPDNATTLSVGDWTLAVYNSSTGTIAYQLGGDDPDGNWQETPPGEDFQFRAHNQTVNGDPVAFDLDPGEPPFEIALDASHDAAPGEGTYGGVNLVAGGATLADVTGVDDDHAQEVVTRPAFAATYIDATSTVTKRLTVDTEYQAFEYDGSGLLDVVLDVEVEDAENLADVDPDRDDIWLPRHDAAENSVYDVSAYAVFSNGTTDPVTANTNFTVSYENDDDEMVECVSFDETQSGQQPGDCGYIAGTGADTVELLPTVLSDRIEIEATVDSGALDTLEESVTRVRNQTVIEPYIGTSLVVDSEAVEVGDSVEAHLALETRNQSVDVHEVPLTEESEDTSVTTVASREMAQALTRPLHLTDHNRDQITDALVELALLDESEREEFLNDSLGPDDRADMVSDGFTAWSVEDMMAFFDADETCADCENVTIEAAAQGLAIESNEVNTDRIGQGVLGVLYAGDEQFDIERLQLHEEITKLNDIETGITDTRVLDLSEPVGDGEFELADPAASTALVQALGYDDSTDRAETAETVFQYFGWLEDHIAGSVYNSENAEIQTALQLLEDEVSDGDTPAGFVDHGTTLVETLAETTTAAFDDWRPSDVDEMDGTNRTVYLWHGGADDPDTREALLDMLAAFEADGAAVERTPEMLLDAVDVSVLAEEALANGDVEPGPDDQLIGSWNLSLVGEYEVQFNRTADTPVTYGDDAEAEVTDPQSNVADIDVELDVPYSDDVDTLLDAVLTGDDDLDTLEWYDDKIDGPLVRGEPVGIETTVTSLDGTTETNPGFVEYELAGPTFDEPTCPEAADFCSPYTGPTDPDGFATIDTGEESDTLTPTHSTGSIMTWLPDGEPYDPSNFVGNESGPLVVEASVDSAGVSDTTAPRSVFDVDRSPSLTAPFTTFSEEPFPFPLENPPAVTGADGYLASSDVEDEEDNVLWGLHSNAVQPMLRYHVDHHHESVHHPTDEWTAEGVTMEEVSADQFDAFWATPTTAASSSIDSVDVSLTAETDDGTTETISRTIPLNHEWAVTPSIDAGTLTPEPGETVTFEPVHDWPDATVYEWTVNNETTVLDPDYDHDEDEWIPVDDPSIEHTFEETDSAEVELVIDIAGENEPDSYPRGPATTTVQVGDVAGTPQPVVGIDPLSPAESERITFDASATRGDVDTYTFTFEDHETETIETSSPTVEYTPFQDGEALQWDDDIDPTGYPSTGYPGVEVVTEEAPSGTIRMYNVSGPELGLSLFPDEYNASTSYNIRDFEDGNGGGGGGLDPDWGNADILASPLEDGKIVEATLTTWQNEEYELNSTVDPDVERGTYDEFDEIPADWFDIDIEEGEETVEYYVWENTEAVLAQASDEWALEDGVVDWRSDSGCSDIGGCLNEPHGLVDYLETTGVQWSSSISISDNEHSIHTTEEDSNSKYHGRHSFDFGVDVQEEDPPEEIDATATIEGTIPADAHDSLSEDVEMSTTIGATVKTVEDDGPEP